MAHYTCYTRNNQQSSTSLTRGCLQLQNWKSIHATLTWNQTKKNTLPWRFTPPKKQWGSREAAVPAWRSYILSCEVWLSERQLLLPKALGSRYLYQATVKHHGGSTSLGRPLPALMSSLMMGAMSSGGLSLQGEGPPSPPCLPSLHLALSVCTEQQQQQRGASFQTFS